VIKECEDVLVQIKKKKVSLVGNDLLIFSRYIHPIQRVVDWRGERKGEVHYQFDGSFNDYLTKEELAHIKAKRRSTRVGVVYPSGSITFFIIEKLNYLNKTETQILVKENNERRNIHELYTSSQKRKERDRVLC
jgi:hypothetical protein